MQIPSVYTIVILMQGGRCLFSYAGQYIIQDRAMSNSLILAVDTSSPSAGFAITREVETIASLSINTQAPHSRTFFSNIYTLLKLANLEINDIDAFAAVTGPGSFTGLRVGLAAVKGLSHALGKPSIGINSIDALALAAGMSGSILVLIDAGRDEVYCGLREVSGDQAIKMIDNDCVGTPSSVLDRHKKYLARDLIIVGDGTFMSRDELEGLAGKVGADLRIGKNFNTKLKAWQLKADRTELAIVVGRYAHELTMRGERREIHAYYIRQSDAEIKLNG